jgi:transposase
MPGRVNVPAFSAFLYWFRNLIERFFNNSPQTFPASCACRNLKPAPLKSFRAIATRFEKHDANYLALTLS